LAGKPGRDFTITVRTGKKKLKRSQERENALKISFACEISGDKAQDQIGRLSDSDLVESTEFVEQLVSLYESHKDEIDNDIIRHLKNWDFSRLAIIDTIILRLAIIELLYLPDIPPEVSINEAIELAKKYSTDKSDKFINGLLDAVFRRLKKEKRISKSGRGLVSKMQL
jgi:N utilization substance protein B